MDDDTPIEELLFELEIGMSERFAGITPLSLRKERANHVFVMISQFNKYSSKEKKKKDSGGKEVIRRRAPDTWF